MTTVPFVRIVPLYRLGLASLLVLLLPHASLAQSLSTGEEHSCAILSGNVLKCWGSSFSGQLGQGNTNNIGDGPNELGDNLASINLGTGRTAKQISAGGFHTCAILDNDAVKCWGEGSNGRLGNGSVGDQGDGPTEMSVLPTIDLGTGRTAKQISAGGSHTCAVLDDDTVKCWGNGGNGRLGQGNQDDIGDGIGVNEMGDGLLPIDLGTGRTAKQISAGGSHTCAVLDDDTLKCWGLGFSGQLGQGNQDTIGDGAGELGNALLPISLGTGRTAKQVSAGGQFTCAILDDDTVKCWGFNSSGQLGLNRTATLGNSNGEMGDLLPIVNLGTGRTAKQISAGSVHACVLLDDNTVKCWGANSLGALGQGHANTIGDGLNEVSNLLLAIDLGTGRTATEIRAGNGHSCAVLDNDTIKCWGASNAGQIGQGSTDAIGNEPDEMGDDLTAIDLGTGLAALPVELTDFSALLNHGNLSLSWTTASETNNAGFELQHQTAAMPTSSWHGVAFIAGQSTTTETQSYAYQVASPEPGIHRFRLKQIDFDGTFAYSSITEVFIPLPDRFDLSAPYPNPFHSQTQVTLSLQHAEHVQITIYDAVGRQIKTLHEGLLTAHVPHTFVFDGAGYASGWYLIEVHGETLRRTQPVLLAQ